MIINYERTWYEIFEKLNEDNFILYELVGQKNWRSKRIRGTFYSTVTEEVNQKDDQSWSLTALFVGDNQLNLVKDKNAALGVEL